MDFNTPPEPNRQGAIVLFPVCRRRGLGLLYVDKATGTWNRIVPGSPAGQGNAVKGAFGHASDPIGKFVGRSVIRLSGPVLRLFRAQHGSTVGF